MAKPNYSHWFTIVIRHLFTILISIYAVFFVLAPLSTNETDKSEQSFFIWILASVTGELKTNNYQKPIVFFTDESEEHVEAIGSAFIQTITLATCSLILGFLVSISLNFLSIFTKSFWKYPFVWIREIFETISSVHIIIIGLGIYLIYRHDTPYLLLVTILAISSNVFYEFSSEQKIELEKILNKDFVLAARAWGDSIWKHIRRSIVLISITQVTSMWITVLTNTLIIEIIFQKKGLGSLIYQNIFASNRGSLVIETNLLLVITISIVIVVSLWNFFKEIIILYLTEVRR